MCQGFVVSRFTNLPHPRSLISTFVVRCLDSMICILAISKVSRLYLVSIAEQAGLSLTWSKMPEDTFSRDLAHLVVELPVDPLSRDMSKPAK